MPTLSPNASGATRTLELAIDGLMALRHIIDSVDFDTAVSILTVTKGSIITTGVGKSGHIARKISSTAVSLGISSYYVHPTEAGHGDMGLIRAGDGLLALSHSGGSTELEALAGHCRWLDVPIVAITSDGSSRLAQAAAIAVVYQKIPESFGKVPTTSTTIQSVIGDMLTIAIAEARGITLESFARNHPGGTIGKANESVLEQKGYKGDSHG